MTPEQYCQQAAAPPGSDLYYSLRCLKSPTHEAVMALQAFCIETRGLARRCRDPEVAAQKLGWWHAEMERLDAGDPQHPITQAIHNGRRHFTLPSEYFLQVLDSVDMDLEHTPVPTFRDLSLYCQGAAGAPAGLWAEICGYEKRDTLKAAHALGTAFELSRVLWDVRVDLNDGRCYIPAEELERFGVSLADLTMPQSRAHVHTLFQFQLRRIREQFHKADAMLPKTDRKHQRSLRTLAALHQARLDEIERDGLRVLEHGIHLTALRKLWIAWIT